MTSKHTPGPWRVESGTTLVWGRCDEDDVSTYGMGIPVAEAKIGSSWRNGPSVSAEEAEANARLIAAAPDLLAALAEAPIPSRYHGAFGFDVDGFLADYAVFSALKRAAIAKARGE